MQISIKQKPNSAESEGLSRIDKKPISYIVDTINWSQKLILKEVVSTSFF